MRISNVSAKDNYLLEIILKDGNKGVFDVKPYLGLEAFSALKNPVAFSRVINGGYFVEWENGADLSADTIEARLKTS